MDGTVHEKNMYYVNEEQINARLDFAPLLTDALRKLEGVGEPDLIAALAQERAIQLAIEVVTDVGSLLIDGFMMRDPGSYEDIIDVLRAEGVLPAEDADGWKAVVELRRSLTQQYMELDRTRLRSDLGRIAELLERFPSHVRAFIERELAPFR